LWKAEAAAGPFFLVRREVGNPLEESLESAIKILQRLLQHLRWRIFEPTEQRVFFPQHQLSGEFVVTDVFFGLGVMPNGNTQSFIVDKTTTAIEATHIPGLNAGKDKSILKSL